MVGATQGGILIGAPRPLRSVGKQACVWAWVMRLGFPVAPGWASLISPFQPIGQPWNRRGGRAGDVRLSDLRLALGQAGIVAEFAAGRLVCGAGRVTVRRADADGELLLEGPLSEDYYRVRDVVYRQYHVC